MSGYMKTQEKKRTSPEKEEKKQDEKLPNNPEQRGINEDEQNKRTNAPTEKRVYK